MITDYKKERDVVLIAAISRDLKAEEAEAPYMSRECTSIPRDRRGESPVRNCTFPRGIAGRERRGSRTPRIIKSLRATSSEIMAGYRSRCRPRKKKLSRWYKPVGKLQTGVLRAVAFSPV